MNIVHLLHCNNGDTYAPQPRGNKTWVADQEPLEIIKKNHNYIANYISRIY